MAGLPVTRAWPSAIDTTQVWLKTAKRNYTLVDAPGHKEFLRNMVTGAAAADGALLVVDAKEGVREQSRRHAYLLGLLGLTQIVVAVNKMDLVGYEQARFAEVARDIESYLGSLGIAPKAVIPVHFAGLPCDLPAIREAADGATIIEDAAHALGARYRSGERVGSCVHSDMAVFSLHPVKSIASGEGGIITTKPLIKALPYKTSHCYW